MNPAPKTFFAAAAIARALGTHKRSVHRQAVRENWARVKNGNRFEYLPPLKVRRQCACLNLEFKPSGLKNFSISDRLRGELSRANFRLAALAELDRHLQGGMGFERALQRVGKEFRFRAAPSALRAWVKQFEQKGFLGLLENKAGVVGRKPREA